MKKTVWKAFINYEKEEDWLNSMSAKGFALASFLPFHYVFNDSLPGEYIYRIELLKNLPGHEESRKYLDFMAESGVEHVTSWGRWVYFRKRAADGPFDIFSDIDSLIGHYKRLAWLWLPIMGMDLLIGISNFSHGVDYLNGTGDGMMFNFVMGIVLLCLSVLIFFSWNTFRLKIKALRRKKTLRE